MGSGRIWTPDGNRFQLVSQGDFLDGNAASYRVIPYGYIAFSHRKRYALRVGRC